MKSTNWLLLLILLAAVSFSAYQVIRTGLLKAMQATEQDDIYNSQKILRDQRQKMDTLKREHDSMMRSYRAKMRDNRY